MQPKTTSFCIVRRSDGRACTYYCIYCHVIYIYLLLRVLKESRFRVKTYNKLTRGDFFAVSKHSVVRVYAVRLKRFLGSCTCTIIYIYVHAVAYLGGARGAIASGSPFLGAAHFIGAFFFWKQIYNDLDISMPTKLSFNINTTIHIHKFSAINRHTDTRA